MRRRATSCSSSTWATAIPSPSRSRAAARSSIRRTRGFAVERLRVRQARSRDGGTHHAHGDAQAIDTSLLGFTISPHEECAVEEALRIVEAHGGSTTVLTLGAAGAAEQLQKAMAMGGGAAVLLGTDGQDWNAGARAGALAAGSPGRP